MEWIKERRFATDGGKHITILRLRSDGAMYYACMTMNYSSEEYKAFKEQNTVQRFSEWLKEDPPLRPDKTVASRGWTEADFDADFKWRLQLYNAVEV